MGDRDRYVTHGSEKRYYGTVGDGAWRREELLGTVRVGHRDGRSCYGTVGWGMEVVGGAMALSGSEAGWERRDLC